MPQLGEKVGARALGELSSAYVKARERLESREPKLRELIQTIDGCESVRLDEMGWLPVIRTTDGLKAALRESVEAEIAELRSEADQAESDLRG